MKIGQILQSHQDEEKKRAGQSKSEYEHRQMQKQRNREEEERQQDSATHLAEKYMHESGILKITDELMRIHPDVVREIKRGWDNIPMYQRFLVFWRELNDIHVDKVIWLGWGKGYMRIGIQQDGSIIVQGDWDNGCTVLKRWQWQLRPESLDEAVVKAYFHPYVSSDPEPGLP